MIYFHILFSLLFETLSKPLKKRRLRGFVFLETSRISSVKKRYNEFATDEKRKILPTMPKYVCADSRERPDDLTLRKDERKEKK